jgi:hypothetical protein
VSWLQALVEDAVAAIFVEPHQVDLPVSFVKELMAPLGKQSVEEIVVRGNGIACRRREARSRPYGVNSLERVGRRNGVVNLNRKFVEDKARPFAADILAGYERTFVVVLNIRREDNVAA